MNGGDDEEDEEQDEFGLMGGFLKGFKGSLRASESYKRWKKEDMMDCGHMREPDAIEIALRKAENGFVVEVDYPRRMVPNPQAESVQSLFSSISKVAGTHEAGQEHDHTAFMKSIGDVVSKIARPAKPLRKSHEEYVFQSMDAMMAFVRETFESADTVENPTPIQK